MNHRTPAEQFRAKLAALSREQLIEAMHYLRGYNSFAMDRALELVTMPVTVAPHCDDPRCVLDDDHDVDHMDESGWRWPRSVLADIHVHLFGQDGICTVCDLDIVTWSQAQGDAELDHIAIEGTLS